MSASGIQRFLFAIKQQGVDEAEATGALEGFASKMNENPEGYRQALARLGVKTKDDKGNTLDRDSLLENFEDYLAKQPFNIARIQAGQFGITGDNAIAALQDPKATHQGLKTFDDKLSAFGFDPNKAAEDARKTTQAWNNLEADFNIIKQKLDSEFFVPMMNSLDALAKKMEANPHTVENFGRALEGATIAVSARVLLMLANLAVKATGLGSVLGNSIGAALGIAVNPVVMLGASAESTPGAGVPEDETERAKIAAENKRLTDEANAKQGSTGSFWRDSWNYIKGKIGLGDDTKVKSDIATTAEATKKLAEKPMPPAKFTAISRSATKSITTGRAAQEEAPTFRLRPIPSIPTPTSRGARLTTRWTSTRTGPCGTTRLGACGLALRCTPPARPRW